METLKIFEMYKAGALYATIAKELNISKKSISGRIDRAVKKGTIERREKLQKTRAKNNGMVIAAVARLNAPKVNPQQWEFKPLKGRGVSILKIKSSQCHFPCTKGVYCGAVATKLNKYCAEHNKVMYSGKGARL